MTGDRLGAGAEAIAEGRAGAGGEAGDRARVGAGLGVTVWLYPVLWLVMEEEGVLLLWTGRQGLLWTDAAFGAVERRRLMIAHVVSQIPGHMTVLLSGALLVK